MADTNVVTWLIGDQRYDVDLFDFDGLEWRDAKRATGMSQNAIAYAALNDKDFEAIAAILWIWRRRTESGLEYDTVLKGLSFGVLGNADEVDVDGGTPDPPG